LLLNRSSGTVQNGPPFCPKPRTLMVSRRVFSGGIGRYEKGAIIVTSNRPLEDWGKVLGDTAAAGAILDRFLHHAEIIKLEGRSYRMYDRKELRKVMERTNLTEETK
jgi:hypothetical protein